MIGIHRGYGRWSISVLIFILLVAAFLRLWRIRDYIVFLGDEGRDALVWHNMVTKGDFTFLGPTASVGGFYLGPIYYYLALPFYYFWQDPVGPAIFVALVGVATVWLVWCVTTKWFGALAGWWAAWGYATAALIVRYARASWNPNTLPFFSLLGMYLAATGNRRRWWKFCAAGVCLGIAWQLHYLALILTPIYLIIAASSRSYFPKPIFPIRPNKLIRPIIPVFLVILGWVIGYSIFIAFEVYHNFPNTRTVIEFLSRPGGSVLDFGAINMLRSATRNSIRLFFTVLSWPDGLLSQAVTGLAVLGGTMAAISAKRYALLWWFYLGIILFSLYQGSISDYYFGFLFPAPFILAGAAVSHLPRIGSIGRAVALATLVVLTINQASDWFLRRDPNRLLQQTEQIALRVISTAGGKSYNFGLISNGNSDHAYRYFLEKHRFSPQPLEKAVAAQLLIVCEKQVADCAPLGNPLWEIAGFGRAEIDQSLAVGPGMTIYRLLHHESSLDLIGRPVRK